MTVSTPSPFQRLIAVLLLLLSIAALDWFVEDIVLAKYQFYQLRIEQHQERLQRANAMLAQRPALEKSINNIQQNDTINAYYLNQSSPTIAATDLQQRVKTAVESNGGELTSVQILPVTTEGAFSRVAIRAQMTGDTEVLQKAFHALESNPPALFIDNIQIRARPIRQRRRNRTEQPTTQISLTTQFELAGYMRGAGS
ncbi:MAG: type II secretion system protein GspM [Candidatus Competibacteraceae bacterium]|jgi:general secretion pathway protein M|nr:type II secretion system protein GspM [Candidatus Competibacteraceae bacterium]